MFVAGLHGSTLYRNRGDGTFEDVTVKAGWRCRCCRREALVGIGWLVRLRQRRLARPVCIQLRGVGTGTESGCSLQGKPLLLPPARIPRVPNQLFHNNHDGTFRDVSHSSGIARSTGKGMGVAFGDFNDDGFPDVFIANDSVPNFLFQNLGNGTFKEVAVASGVAYAANGNPVAGMGADFRDFDEDGRDDIVLSAMYFDTFPLYPKSRQAPASSSTRRNLPAWPGPLASSPVGVWACTTWTTTGTRISLPPSPTSPAQSPTPGSEAPSPNHVLRGSAVGTFVDVSPFAGADFQRAALYHGAAFADFDNDGRVDVVVTAQNSPARLFRNTSASPGHWIALKLEGTRSNRDGLGARVRLTRADGRVAYNHATTSVGYASSSEPLVRFGLGPYDSVKEIRIQWPSGSVQVLSELKADRVVPVKEP